MDVIGESHFFKFGFLFYFDWYSAKNRSYCWTKSSTKLWISNWLTAWFRWRSQQNRFGRINGWFSHTDKPEYWILFQIISQRGGCSPDSKEFHCNILGEFFPRPDCFFFVSSVHEHNSKAAMPVSGRIAGCRIASIIFLAVALFYSPAFAAKKVFFFFFFILWFFFGVWKMGKKLIFLILFAAKRYLSEKSF